MRVTPKQKQVLAAIRDLYLRRSEHPDHQAIAVECDKEYSRADWAHEPLRSLSKLRLVSSIGKASPYGGRRWKINKSGLKLLGND
jgi:hypothetical protein